MPPPRVNGPAATNDEHTARTDRKTWSIPACRRSNPQRAEPAARAISPFLHRGVTAMSSTVSILAASLIVAAAGISSTGGKAAQANSPDPASAQKYCIEYEKIVGSRISQTECKTKKQWADQGVDVDELLKKEPGRK
jgi:hypothetical protein